MAVTSVHLTTHSGVKDIYITEDYKFALVVTFSGVECVNLLTTEVVSSGTIPGGYRPMCVAADWVTATGLLYVGTSGGGIFTAPYHPIRQPQSNFSGSLTLAYSTATPTPVSSNIITDIVVRPPWLFVGTTSGVDFITNERRSVASTVSGTTNVILTESGGGYWTTTSSIQVNYNLPNSTGTGIINVDFEYTPDSDPPLLGIPPAGIAVSATSPRTLAFATPSGAVVIEERQGMESTAQRKLYQDPNEGFEPVPPGFVGIGLPSKALYNSGLLYATTTGTARIFDLSIDPSVDEPLNFPQSYDTIFNATGGVARGQTLVSGVVNTNTLQLTSLA